MGERTLALRVRWDARPFAAREPHHEPLALSSTGTAFFLYDGGGRSPLLTGRKKLRPCRYHPDC